MNECEYINVHVCIATERARERASAGSVGGRGVGESENWKAMIFQSKIVFAGVTAGKNCPCVRACIAGSEFNKSLSTARIYQVTRLESRGRGLKLAPHLSAEMLPDPRVATPLRWTRARAHNTT
jgi:hypothetical protein